MDFAGGRIWLLLVVVVGAYAGAWSAGLVWDDVPLVVQNPTLNSLANLPVFFTGDLWAGSGAIGVESGYYRPLVLVSFALDRAVFGEFVPGYHMHNLAWHLAAVVLSAKLLRLVVSGEQALLGATVFALHPVQSEAVVWVSARNDLMAAAFGLAAVLVAARHPKNDRLRWWGVFVLAAAAALSKESAYLMPLLLWGFDWVRGEKLVWRRYTALSGGIAVALVARLIAGVGGATMPPAEGWGLLIRNLHRWIGVTAGSVVWPWPISSARDLHWIQAESTAHMLVGGLGLCLCFLVASRLDGRARRLFIGGALWSVASIALTVVPIADKGGFGDRFWYLPMFGVSVMVAAICPLRWCLRGCVAFSIPAMVVLHARLPDWISDKSLWWSAMRDRPIAVNLVGYGHALFINEQYKRSLVAFQGALVGNSLAVDACPRVISSAVRLGRPQLAVRMGRWALHRGCTRDGKFNGWFASAHAFSGDWEGVASVLEQGPPDPLGRDQVARFALASVRNDVPTMEKVVAAWSGSGDLEAQAEKLLVAAARAGVRRDRYPMGGDR